jgi:hypothetical protein
MHIVVQHQVADPQTFFGIAQATPVPENLKLHQMFPATDGSLGVCLWDADSLAEVRNLVEQHVGHVSTNQCYQVAAGNALGLPASAGLASAAL